MHGTTTYPTLDAALTDIAGRSFYESARVSKVAEGYAVEDWHTGVEESTDWTYADGATVPANTVDHSRTHEPYEYYETAGHIRYNLPNAVSEIEEGVPVGFTYVIADAPCECGDDIECYGDHAAGWLLIATPEGDAL